MTSDEMTDLLERLERRLANLASQAYQTCDQAKRTFDQLQRLSRDLARLKEDLLSEPDTGVYRALPASPK